MPSKVGYASTRRGAGGDGMRVMTGDLGLQATDFDDVESVRRLAVIVFGSRRAAKRWFRRPARGLGWEVPVDLMATVEGRKRVATYLLQIEYGVYV